MKHIIVIISIFLILSAPVLMPCAGSIFSYKSLINNFDFSPEDIELKDDAFHGSRFKPYTEWWYFDAAFDNGYSIQIHVRVVSRYDQGMVYLRMNIYKHGVLISEKVKVNVLSEFSASLNQPLIKLNDKQIMKGYIDNTSGSFVYDVSLEIYGSSANLSFIGCTKGWKGNTLGGKWAVILPKANVTGTIINNNKEIQVNGVGYHDHNWDVTLLAGINFGWFWGKTNSDNYTITWSNIMRTRFSNNPLLVINQNYGDYINIESDEISFIAKNYRINNGMIIPTSFNIIVSNKNISLNISLEVLEIHHERLRGFVNYWRYHIRYTGSIKVDSQKETIDELQIMEFIRFR